MSLTRTKGEHFAPKENRRTPPRKKRSGKGAVVFNTLYISFTLLAVAAVVVGLCVLWGFLAEYESCLPEKVVERAIKPLEQGDYTAVYDSAGFAPNRFEDDSAAREYVSGLFSGEISYSKDVRLSTEETPIYAVKSGGRRVCTLTLKDTGKRSDRGFPLYQAAEFSGVEIPTSGISVTAPDNAELRINGVPMREMPLKSEQIKECAHFYGYIDEIPAMAEYRAEGFTREPEVTALRNDGTALSQEKSGAEYRFSLDGGEIPSELSEYAADASMTYSKYISADAPLSALAQYIPQDVPLYDNISTYEAKFYTPHSGYDFLDVSVGDFRRYTEDCVSLRVTYTQRIYAGYLGDYDFPTDNTLYLAKSGGEWIVTDIVMN